MKSAYVLLFDGYADWEIGYALAELRRMGEVPVTSVGFSEKAVVSMGGLKVQPDIQLADVDIDDVLIFILSGGTLWEGTYPEEEVHSFLRELDQRSVPLAAICAATTVMARAGILNNRRHTSNSLRYLSDHALSYAGQAKYIAEMAVTDGHVITASGLGSIDFTMKILEALDIATPAMRSFWYRAFKFGEYPEDIEPGN